MLEYIQKYTRFDSYRGAVFSSLNYPYLKPLSRNRTLRVWYPQLARLFHFVHNPAQLGFDHF